MRFNVHKVRAFAPTSFDPYTSQGQAKEGKLLGKGFVLHDEIALAIAPYLSH